MSTLLFSIAFMLQVLQITGGEPKVIDDLGPYTRVALTEYTTMEVYETDRLTVVLTSCAPQCSSCARIYNKEGELLEEIQPPFTSIFPLATINPKTGEVIWKDNDTWNYQSTL